MRKLLLIPLLLSSCNTLETVYVPNNLNKIKKNLDLMEKYVEYDLKNGLMDSTSAFDYLLIINNTRQGVIKMNYKLNTNTKR
tara:strand:- start:302 stop:547 length:246 start_codon:yes stop_codon:yes gene_type:complete